jgi:hypothetical protein
VKPSIPAVFAAAVCRVAVEDWLETQTGFDLPTRLPSGEYVIWVNSLADNLRGPTIHHVLVDAAMLAADRK